nr:MAG TPA: hypothetical protein [Caudoviricetes sp.]
MEFDKSRIYTAVNADELQIGSKVILSNVLSELKEAVEVEKEEAIQTLAIIRGENEVLRFVGDKYHSGYTLAYLIEPPTEKKYKPFESVEEAMKAIKAHGGWITDVEAKRTFLVQAYENSAECKQLLLGHSWVTLDDLFEIFVFADDGTPCGVLVEE